MALHQYQHLPTHRDNLSDLTLNRQSYMFKWIWRRILRFWWLGSTPIGSPHSQISPSSYSLKCFVFLFTALVFMLFSTQLYMGLQSDSVQVIPPSDTGVHSGYNLSTYLREISKLFPQKDYDRMLAQIDNQLSMIELSLKENRRILQQIRSDINSAGTNITNVLSFGGDDDSEHANHLYNVHSSQNWFYQYSNDRCDSRVNSQFNSSYFPGDINMQHVYDGLKFDNPDGGVWKQGWEIDAPPKMFDHKSGKPKLKVFVLPHSHNDPGWIKTFDVYFRQQTKSILTLTTEQINLHPDMRMIWAESSYLSAWWETAPSDQHRELFRKLAQLGRIEIVTGGWVMNDEANTHYSSILAQMVEGHEWLEDTLGVSPRHGWAIDPFGLSPTMAYLLKEMGIRAMVIQRVHYSIKKYLARNKQLEFWWRQPWETNVPQDILCHIEPFYSYDIPHTCGPDPKVCCQFDFKRLPPSRVKCPWKISPKVISAENIEERAKLLLDQYRKKSRLYSTNSLLVPLGDDFRYDNPKEWNDQYKNYRKLFDYMNSNSEMNIEIKFSTLADYFDSVLNASEPAKPTNEFQFPSLVGDFFTYCDREDHYWSGYFTSKPFYKRFERVLESHLRATEILFSIANILSSQKPNPSMTSPFNESVIYDFIYARQNFALFQHHDAIAGTAKDFVVKDYSNRMYKSFVNLERIATVSLHTLAQSNIFTNPSSSDSPVKLEFMHRFPNEVTPPKKHIFILEAKSNRHFVLFNSLGWDLDSQIFCFDIEWKENSTALNWCLSKSDPHQLIDDIQINYIWSSYPSSDHVMTNRKEVCFRPKLNALSLTQFCVGNCGCNPLELTTLNHQKQESFVTLYNFQNNAGKIPPIESHILSMLNMPSDVMIQNEYLKLHFDSGNNGLLKLIEFLDVQSAEWIRMDCFVQIMTYKTRAGGKNVPKSGAYIFLPDQSGAEVFNFFGKPIIKVTVGNLESRYEWSIENPFPVYLRWSLYRGRRSVEFTSEFQLHGLYSSNKELLLRFNLPEIDNKDRFYTDLNGFQVIGRKRYDKIPLQGNVYPLNTMAFIESDISNEAKPKRPIRFAILSGQPLGVTSTSSGTLDVFLDRRLMQDDQRGLNQGVIDNKYTREVFRLLLERPNRLTDPVKPKPSSASIFESQTLLNPVIGITSANLSLSNVTLLSQTMSFAKKSFPCDLHLVNFRRSTKQNRRFGLWLHRIGMSCDSICTDPVSNSKSSKVVSFSELFSDSLLSQLDGDRVIRTGISLLNRTDHAKHHTFDESLQIDPMEIVAYKLFLKGH